LFDESFAHGTANRPLLERPFRQRMGEMCAAEFSISRQIWAFGVHLPIIYFSLATVERMYGELSIQIQLYENQVYRFHKNITTLKIEMLWQGYLFYVGADSHFERTSQRTT
jgi:hypothetical protein